MYHVYYTNHSYAASDTFASIDAAKAYGKSKGLEFTVYRANHDYSAFSNYSEWMASWLHVGNYTVFGGWQTA